MERLLKPKTIYEFCTGKQCPHVAEGRTGRDTSFGCNSRGYYKIQKKFEIRKYKSDALEGDRGTVNKCIYVEELKILYELEML